MDRIKLFLENFLIYGLGGVISKLIPLVMLPVVTRMMPDTSYFGISDMSNTVVQFGSALAVMGMYDAMYRMFFEKDDEEYKKSICSTAFVFTMTVSLAVSLIMVLCREFIAERFFEDSKYTCLVYIAAVATLAGATNSIVSAPTRMQNKRKIFLVMNAFSPVLSYSIAMVLLLNGHYVLALPVAAMMAGVLSELIFLCLNKEWFHLKNFDAAYLKPLLSIGVPLLPNFLIYWIFNSSDKLMITNMLGTSATGVYSVGAKLGHASQLIYTAFAGGWQFFAFSTMKESGQVESNSRIFEYLGVISFSCTMFVFALARSFYQVLFTGDYVGGYIISPYLFLAPLLQMLFQVACNQFLVIKKTWPNMLILSAGAAANIFLNLFLIPRIGIEGAAIATLTGYIISDMAVVAVLCKMGLMVIRKRFLIASALMLSFILMWRLFFYDCLLWGLMASAAVSGMLVFLYYPDLKELSRQIKSKRGAEE